jgi:hypothetical protein
MRFAARFAAAAIVLLLPLLSGLAVPRAARADSPVAAAEALPSGEQLHQLFKDKQYAVLLQKLSRVLQLRGDAARTYDRIDLLLLKVEAHLQLKEQSLAIAAATAAVKAIDEDHTDLKQAAVARATEKLLKQTHGYTFTPRTAPRGQIPQPISLLDVDRRADCFAAMFNDAKFDIASKMRAAKSAKTLVPIIDAIKAVGELRTLELAAYGKDEQSVAQLDGLANQAKDLMAKAVKDLKAQADKDHDRANDVLPVRIDARVGASNAQLYYKKGLEGDMLRELNKIIAESEAIADAARQFADISKAAAEGFGEVQEAAEKVAKSAKATLEDDYTGTYSK